ncbi:MAG: hypothetical protein WDA59_01655 [Methanofastidiosum sp.]
MSRKKIFVIQGTVMFSMNREIEAEDLDEAEEIADELTTEDLFEEDLDWPPYDLVVENVYKKYKDKKDEFE